jgi:exopolysaccharide biosynthesis polyprenyl glycosylphosphotransferase
MELTMSSTSAASEETVLTHATEAMRVREHAESRLDIRLVARAGGLLAVWLAIFVPYLAQRPLTWAGLASITIAAAMWSAAIRSAQSSIPAPLGTSLATAVGTFTGVIPLAAVNPWLPGLQLPPLALLGMAVGVWASAATWAWFVCQTSAGRRRVLFVGTDDVAVDLLRQGGCADAARFRLVGRIQNDQPATSGEVPCLGGLDALAEVVKAQRPDLVVLSDERTYANVVDRLLDVAGAGVRVVGLAGFFEHAFGRVPLANLTPAWFMGILHLRQPLHARWSKRAFDLLGAAAGLLLVLPILPVIALLVRTTRGPIVYRQTRLGEGGRPFTIYKFRTMIAEAEATGQPQWCVDGDERVTPIGRLLRRVHLDEIPQLWNVLKGDMSIVGPRPERPEFVRMLENEMPFWTRRLLIKPGVTGWAQVRSGYCADCASCADKLSYDLWYIRHRSFAVDAAVCVQTARLMASSLFARSGLTREGFARPEKGA